MPASSRSWAILAAMSLLLLQTPCKGPTGDDDVTGDDDDAGDDDASGGPCELLMLNQTGQTLTSIRFAETGPPITDDDDESSCGAYGWTDLWSGSLGPGDSATGTVDEGDWCFMATDELGNGYVVDFQTCSGGSLSLSFTPDEGPLLTVHNRSGQSVTELSLAATTDMQFGANLLAGGSLADEAMLELYPAPGQSYILATDVAGDHYFGVFDVALNGDEWFNLGEWNRYQGGLCVWTITNGTGHDWIELATWEPDFGAHHDYPPSHLGTIADGASATVYTRPGEWMVVYKTAVENELLADPDGPWTCVDGEPQSITADDGFYWD